MSSSDFPTYGRGDDPAERDDSDKYAKPAPYGQGEYAQPPAEPPAQQPGAQPGQPGTQPVQPGPPPFEAPGQRRNIGQFGPPAHHGQPGQFGQPGSYGGPSQYAPPAQQPPAVPGQFGQPGQYGQPGQFGQPGQYGVPGQPYPQGAHPQQQPPGPVDAYGHGHGPLAEVGRDARAAKVLLIAAISAGVYGLLVLTVQRVSLREIVQAPGSSLNHPLRTDVIDSIGQLLVLIVGAAAIGMWARDVVARRKAKVQPDPVELAGLGLVAASLIPLLIWLVMVLSTGMGAIDETLERLPTAYGWGGLGLLLLAAGFALGYRALKPEVSNPIIRPAPQRPPWE